MLAINQHRKELQMDDRLSLIVSGGLLITGTILVYKSLKENNRRRAIIHLLREIGLGVVFSLGPVVRLFYLEIEVPEPINIICAVFAIFIIVVNIAFAIVEFLNTVPKEERHCGD
jgi:lipid-A-disaccharide synthase-like uncharacterized protein